jgi:cytochrome P450
VLALTDYGPRIEEFTDTLLTRLDKTAGQEVLVNEFCLHYTWDVMSGIGYGSETRFIEGESTDFANTLVAKIKEGIAAISFLAHVPWLLTVAESLTFLGGPLKMFRTWSQEQVKRRRLVSGRRCILTTGTKM